MRKQLVDNESTPLYGALQDDNYTFFSEVTTRDKRSKMTAGEDVNGSWKGHEDGGTEKKLKYPKSVFFIISNEFCERFSYYGMRSVLALYLKNALNYSENSSTIIYHVFVMLCYFTPLFGGIMADAWLGKFRTILYVSLVYATGNIVLSFGSVESISIPHRELSILGLLLIAIGTGGIKPCVSSFGGDQFVLPQQEKQLQTFFSVFYFSINAGSVISSILTPLFRNYHCLGSDDDCYPLAFGLPAVLMIVALVVFVCGSPLYKKSKSSGNIAMEVGGCVSHAVARKIGSSEKRSHWLDHADDKYSNKIISDTKILMKLMLLFSPTIVFWALFEQQGSKWTFQATRLNGDLGWFVIVPDQMQTLNAVLVLIFIPLFETVIYPLLAALRLIRTPLRKLCVGGFLAALAFVISGILEIKIEADSPSLPGNGQSRLIVYNSFNCEAQFTGGVNTTLPALGIMSLPDLPANNVTTKVNGTCFKEWNNQIILIDGQVSSYLLLSDEKFDTDLFPLNLTGRNEVVRQEKSDPKIKVIYSGLDDISVELKHGDETKDLSILQKSHQTQQLELKNIGAYTVTVNKKPLKDITVAQGGVYTLMLANQDGSLGDELFIVTDPNSVHILWQIPQYVVITSAEIMFSITGLEFSYSQSPASLKSIISSLWLLTDALGNVLILIIEGSEIENKILEFFLYAGVMAVAMVIFSILAMRYKPSKEEIEEDHQLEEQTKI